MRSKPLLALLLASAPACAPAEVQDTTTGGDGGDGGTVDNCPTLRLSSESITFSDVHFGLPAEEYLTVTNDCVGTGAFTTGILLASDASTNFTASTETATLSPGESHSFTLGYTATSYASEITSVEVWTDMGSNPILTVSGLPNLDQDGDGANAEEAGGGDCNDADDSVYPQENEQAHDEADDDCDGTVDEDFIVPGMLAITELMVNPEAVDDAYGEWIEFTNLSYIDMHMKGWTIVGADGDSYTFEEDVEIPYAGSVVIGVSDSNIDNGGVQVDHVYPREQFSLADAKDSVFVYIAGNEIFSLSYDDSWQNEAGSSLQVDSHSVGYNSAAQWCVGEQVYGDGDRGTPGEPNDWCTSVDHDGDGYSEDTGDCDDNDPTRSPGETEAWDGIDNNCDGLVDQITTDSATGVMYGDSSGFAGYGRSTSVGDLNDDGTDDLVLGSIYQGGSNYAYPGGVYLIDGGDALSAAGDLEDEAWASFAGSNNYGALSVTGIRQGDVDGDGATDLFLSGADTYSPTYGATVAGVLFLDTASLSGELDEDDADVSFTDSDSYGWYHSGLSSLDINGDGATEIVYGDYYAGTQYAGVVHIFRGSGLDSGDSYDLDDDDDWSMTGATSQDQLGSALGGGDLDGDGYGDLVIGAQLGGTNNGGQIYVVMGDLNLASLSITAQADHQIDGDSAQGYLGGYAEPLVADLEDDGNMDLIVSAPGAGEVYVFFDFASGGGNLDASDADLIIEGDGPGYFGYTLEAADFDGDGIDELAVGAPDHQYMLYAQYLDEPGEVSVFDDTTIVGASSLGSHDADLLISGTENDGLGAAVLGADLDDDGTAEAIIASPASNAGASSGGAVWIFGL